MSRSSTIIRELVLNLAKVIFTLKHSVKLCRYLLCGCVAACNGKACVFYAVQNATESHSASLISIYTGRRKSAGHIYRICIYTTLHVSEVICP
jgi:hypothetical protein